MSRVRHRRLPRSPEPRDLPAAIGHLSPIWGRELAMELGRRVRRRLGV